MEVGISVIIPVYNTEKYIEDCINSVLENDFDNFEIICVNDGSTDSSLDIMNAMAEKDERIKVISKENGGQSSARNLAIDNASGKYMYFLDSDDRISSDALSELFKCLETNQLDVLYFSGDAFYETEELEQKFPAFMKAYYREGVYEAPCKGLELLPLLQEQSDYSVSPCIQIVRRQFILDNDIRFYEGIIHEDNLFSFKVIFNAERAFCINGVYFHRRVREDSVMTVAKNYKNLFGYYMCFVKVIEYLADKEISAEEQACVEKVIRGLKAHVSRSYLGIPVEERDIFYQKIEEVSMYYKLLFRSINLHGMESEVRITRKLNRSNRALRQARKDLEDIKNSNSYKVGRIITWPIRKIKALFAKK